MVDTMNIIVKPFFFLFLLFEKVILDLGILESSAYYLVVIQKPVKKIVQLRQCPVTNLRHSCITFLLSHYHKIS